MIVETQRKSHSIFFSIHSISNYTSRERVQSTEREAAITFRKNQRLLDLKPTRSAYKQTLQAYVQHCLHHDAELLLAQERLRNNAVTYPCQQGTH